MPFTGFLKVPGIAGESRHAGRKDEIDVFDVMWQLSQKGGGAKGRAPASATSTAFDFRKFVDAASPYLAHACALGRSFPEIVFTVRRDSGEAHLDYLTIRLINCLVSSYQIDSHDRPDQRQLLETVSIRCEKIEIRYVVQTADHSAGDRHVEAFDVSGAKGR